jgi:hypothetical protein
MNVTLMDSGFVCYNFHMLTKSPTQPQLALDTIEMEMIDPCTALDMLRSSLSESDQQILNDLLVSAANFSTALAECGQCMPEKVVLLAMLLEERKELLRLRKQFAA